MRMLQLEERDRSCSEEQRAGSQRTTRTWRLSVQQSGITAARRHRTDVQTRNTCAPTPSALHSSRVQVGEDSVPF